MKQGTGTIAYTTGSNVLTGTGTAFLTELAKGRHVVFLGDRRVYTIDTVTDNATATITQAPPVGRAAMTYSGLSFAIGNGQFTPFASMPLPTRALQDSAAVMRRAVTIVDRELPRKKKT